MKDFLSIFWPPEDETPRAKRMWRQWIGLGMIGIWVFAWWAVGATAQVAPFLGQGFAKHSTVLTVQVELLEERILENRIRHCNATSAQSRAFIFDLIQKQMRRYRELTGQEYRLPECGDLAGL